MFAFLPKSYRVVLILPSTVVSIEVNNGRVDTMMLQVVVDHTDDSIGSLPSQECFINQEVHLLRNRLAADSKYPTLTWSEEINWAWL